MCVSPAFRARARRRAADSFTLVEVVIAIAVLAFVLVSVLGLMAYASQLVQQSDNYSRLSSVARQMLSRYNSQPFVVSTNAATTNAVYYFSFEGLPTNQVGAYYQCDVTNASPSNWGLSTNMMQIQMSVRWPMTNAVRKVFPNTNVIITSTLNYN